MLTNPRCVLTETKCVSTLYENLLLHVATAHRVPLKWKNTYENFRVRCAVYYAGKQLSPEVFTQAQSRLAEGLHDTYIWDDWLVYLAVVCGYIRKVFLAYQNLSLVC